MSNRKKLLAFARKKAKEFVKQVDAANYPSIAYYGACTEKEFRPSGNHACHAGLGYPRGYGGGALKGTIEYVIDAIYPKEGLEDSVRIAYIDFIMNCPAYKDVLVTTKAEEAYKDGYVLAKAERPANHLASCLFSLRMASERPKMIQTWYDLVELGVDKSVAYILCHSILIKDKQVFIINPETHHIGLNVRVMGRENVLNFITGTHAGIKKMPYSEDHNYLYVEGLFGRNGDFHPAVKAFIKEASKGGKVDDRPYLFYKAPAEDKAEGTYPINETLIKGLLEFSKTLVEEAKQ